MKRIIFLIAAISTVVFPSTPKSVYAEMKSYFDNRDGYYSNSRGIIPYERGDSPEGRASVNHPSLEYHYGRRGSIHLGPFDLGIEGKYLEKDPYDRFRDSNFNRIMMQGFIGFRF